MSALRYLRAAIDREVAVEFDSRYDLSTSVRRLAERTQPSVLRTLFREAAVGRVEAGEVRLRRYNPWLRNDFAPCFVGAFDRSAGRVVLRGSFRARRATRVLFAFWLGFGALWTLAATLAALRDPTRWPLPLAGLLLLLFGVGLLVLGRAIGGADVDWLTRLVRQALGGDARPQSGPP